MDLWSMFVWKTQWKEASRIEQYKRNSVTMATQLNSLCVLNNPGQYICTLPRQLYFKYHVLFRYPSAITTWKAIVGLSCDQLSIIDTTWSHNILFMTESLLKQWFSSELSFMNAHFGNLNTARIKLRWTQT